MNDFFNKYQQLKQQSDEAVAQNYKSYISSPINQNLQDTFSNAITGATVAPSGIAPGAIDFAQKLASRGNNPYVSPQEFESLISAVKNNLKLPQKMIKNPDINKLISEILGMQKKFSINKITPK